jgi:hypothetical protein
MPLHPFDYLIELDDADVADKPVARQTSIFADFEKLLPTQLENLTERMSINSCCVVSMRTLPIILRRVLSGISILRKSRIS